jgi:hypothetical protein
MHIFLSILLYISIVIAVLQNWVGVALFLVALFSFWYKAATLIPLAFLIDGYFGNFHTIPYISIISIFWYVIIEYAYPVIRNPHALEK